MEAGSTDWSQTVWVLVPFLSLVSCVALGKLLGLSVLQLSHLFHENIIGPTVPVEDQKDRRMCV